MVDLSVVLCITSIPVNTEITGHDRRLTTWHSDPQTKQLEPGAFNHQPILGVFSSYRWISNSTRLDTFCTKKTKQNTPFTATVISLCDCSLQVSDLNTTYDWKCTVSVHRLHFQLSRKKKKNVTESKFLVSATTVAVQQGFTLSTTSCSSQKLLVESCRCV